MHLFKKRGPELIAGATAAWMKNDYVKCYHASNVSMRHGQPRHARKTHAKMALDSKPLSSLFVRNYRST
jgi:hypothetical protein